MSSLDQVDAEMYRILGNMPMREYPNIIMLNGDHLRFLRVTDERLVRLEAVITKHHNILIHQ